MTTGGPKAQSSKTTENLTLREELATLDAEVLAFGTSGPDFTRLASHSTALVGMQAQRQAGESLELVWSRSRGRLTSCWRQASSCSHDVKQT
jgi:hypothetical protein